MKVKFAFLLLGVCLLSGCLQVAHLYPVQGPLAGQTPPPVYAVKVTGAFNSGGISVTLVDGEVFKGPWKALSVEDRAQASRAPQSFSLASAWDTVYGPGFYTSHVLGTRLFAQASLTGSRGTVLQVEMYRQVHAGEDNPSSGVLPDIRGVAKDSSGNIYKLAF
jgi:hypothetical protein